MNSESSESNPDLLRTLLETVERLERKVDALADKLCPNLSKMDAHIDFVETVYETVRGPLNFVRRRLGFRDKAPPAICGHFVEKINN